MTVILTIEGQGDGVTIGADFSIGRSPGQFHQGFLIPDHNGVAAILEAQVTGRDPIHEVEAVFKADRKLVAFIEGEVGDDILVGIGTLLDVEVEPVCAVTAGDGVRTRTAVDFIIATKAVDDFIFIAALQIVCAAATFDLCRLNLDRLFNVRFCSSLSAAGHNQPADHD